MRRGTAAGGDAACPFPGLTIDSPLQYDIRDNIRNADPDCANLTTYHQLTPAPGCASQEHVTVELLKEEQAKLKDIRAERAALLKRRVACWSMA